MTAPDDLHPPDEPLGEHTYRLICEHRGVALLATDPELRIRVWNPAAAHTFGASADSMMGTSVLSVFPAEHRDEADRRLRRALERGSVEELEFSYRDQAGETRYLAASISPLSSAEDEIHGLAIWVRDITRRTRLAAQLASGRKMGALGEMAGAVAHYFNNILGGLVTSVDFALASNDPQLQQRVLEKTSRSLARATRLMTNLLSFAEGDRRSADLADLTEVVVEAIDRIEPELARQDIQLDVRFPPEPVAEVPRQAMLTVIGNLIDNAVEAMPDGGRIRVELEQRGRKCLLRVGDMGCGLSEEELERIFEPFYSTKPIAGGSEDRAPGLGLAVVHGLVGDLGGRISVQSRRGVGSTFEVELDTGQAGLPGSLPGAGDPAD